jgi:hypothetical protein
MLEKIAQKNLQILQVILLHGEIDDTDVYAVTWKHPLDKAEANLRKVGKNPVILLGDLPSYSFRSLKEASRFYNSVVLCKDGVVRFAPRNNKITEAYPKDKRRTFFHGAIY